MHAASRDSLKAVRRKFDEVTTGLESAELNTLADDLAGVVELLNREALLRKHLGGGGDDAEPRVRLADSLLSGKVSAPALDVVKNAVAQRWSISRDLTEALEQSARLAILIDAERTNQIENTEDELFRFGRTLEANPKLDTLLSDTGTPADGRISLLDNVLGGKTTSWTTRLLQQTVRLLRAERLETVVAELAELAAERRGESVAHVVSAVSLTDAQIERLTAVLSRIYGRTMSIQLDLDPEVLGGLQIKVGDEVVDGTISSRLAAAADQLPR